MRAFDNGSLYLVTVSRNEVSAFARRWPCCNLPDSSITFQFDKRNGDLVDITPYRIADKVDGPEALALADDAQTYGRARLRLTDNRAS